MRRIYTLSNSAFPARFGKVLSESDPITGNFGYALGLYLAIYDGWEIIGHNGYWPSFASVMYAFPKKKIGIFIISNGPGATGGKNDLSLDYLATFIFDILRVSPRNVSTNQNDLLLPNFETLHHGFDLSTLPPLELRSQNRRQQNDRTLDELIGLYGNGANGDLYVLYDESDDSNQTLIMKFGEYEIGRLLPQEQDLIFTVELTTDILQLFYTYDFNIVYELDLRFEKLVILLFYGQHVSEFVKVADLESFLPIPGSPESYGPSN